VTYRVPVEVGLEIETGEIINVHIMDEKVDGPIGVFNYEPLPIGGRLKEEMLKLVEVAERPGLDLRMLTLATTPRDRLGPSQVLPPNEQCETERT